MDDRVFPVKFLTHFMLPLYVVLFTWMLAFGVGVVAGWIPVEGPRSLGWVLILLPVALTAMFVRRIRATR